MRISCWAEDGYIGPSKKEYYENAKTAYDNFTKLDISWDSIRIVALDRNSGVFTGEADFLIIDRNGKEYKGNVAATYVFQKKKKGMGNSSRSCFPCVSVRIHKIILINKRILKK